MFLVPALRFLWVALPALMRRPLLRWRVLAPPPAARVPAPAALPRSALMVPVPLVPFPLSGLSVPLPPPAALSSGGLVAVPPFRLWLGSRLARVLWLPALAPWSSSSGPGLLVGRPLRLGWLPPVAFLLSRSLAAAVPLGCRPLVPVPGFRSRLALFRGVATLSGD